MVKKTSMQLGSKNHSKPGVGAQRFTKGTFYMKQEGHFLEVKMALLCLLHKPPVPSAPSSPARVHSFLIQDNTLSNNRFCFSISISKYAFQFAVQRVPRIPVDSVEVTNIAQSFSDFACFQDCSGSTSTFLFRLVSDRDVTCCHKIWQNTIKYPFYSQVVDT